MCLVTTIVPRKTAVLDIGKYSSFTKLKRVTACLVRFVYNSRVRKDNVKPEIYFLAVREITTAECYWLSISQGVHFSAELEALKSHSAKLSRASPSFHGFIGAHSCWRQRAALKGTVF